MAKELVNTHGMTQVQVAKLFGVTSAAVSQYIKGVRGGNSIIDKSAYKGDFYKLISDMAEEIVEGYNVTEAFCQICTYVYDSGLIKALYVFEGYPADELGFLDIPRANISPGNDTNEH